MFLNITLFIISTILFYHVCTTLDDEFDNSVFDVSDFDEQAEKGHIDKLRNPNSKIISHLDLIGFPEEDVGHCPFCGTTRPLMSNFLSWLRQTIQDNPVLDPILKGILKLISYYFNLDNDLSNYRN